MKVLIGRTFLLTIWRLFGLKFLLLIMNIEQISPSDFLVRSLISRHRPRDWPQSLKIYFTKIENTQLYLKDCLKISNFHIKTIP